MPKVIRITESDLIRIVEKAIKEKKMTRNEKLEELNKIVQRYGLFSNQGVIRTYDAYCKMKEENPNYNNKSLDQQLTAKKEELNFKDSKQKKGRGD